MEKIRCDLCVIGAGSGGLSVAAGAVQMGASVVLVEAGKMGGDCLNYGCVPSKSLIAAAAVAHGMKGGQGTAAAEADVDFAAVKDHVQAVIGTIAPHDSQERFEGLGVKVIRAHARFVGPREVEAGDHVIRARRFVIATGSSPLIPPIPGLAGVPYLTNETIFDLRQRPGHLLIIGGGPIGVEMAQAHQRLGCQVTVIEAQKVLGQDDPDLVAAMTGRLRDEGVRILEGVSAKEVRQAAGGIEVVTQGGGAIAGTHLLVAVGRKANTDGLGLEAAGITADRAVTVDGGLRTSNRRVYAIGDVAGGMQFTHVAGYHAGLVVRSALFGMRARLRTDHIPRVTYTDPELAQIGLTQAAARAAHGDAVEVLRVDFAGNDRAVASGRTAGMIKVMVMRGRPVGVSIVGAGAGELVGLWALAISARLKMSAIAGMVAPYPTLSEISKRAAGAYFSPRLFENAKIKHIVGFVQRFLP